MDEREQALHYAARLRGLTLVRSGDKYALVQYFVSDATLDEVAAFLAEDSGAEPAAGPGERLRAMLKAERALLVELEEAQRKAGEGARDTTAESALADIRRRIAEIQGEMEGKRSG